MRMGYGAPLMAALGVLLAACGAEAQGQPRAGARLDGVYYGLKSNGMTGRVGPDFYTFLSDGRVFNGDPQEGLARPTVWETECRYAMCGTYSVGAGGAVRIQWQAPSSGTTTLRIDPQGVLRGTGSTERSWRPLRLLEGRLNGTYGVRGYNDQGIVTEITFTPDGHFRERGVLEYVNWDDLSPENRRAVVKEGEGTYTLHRGTLELRYTGGPTVWLMVMVPPAGNVETALFINRSDYRRLR